MKKLRICVLALLCPLLSMLAQTPSSNIQPLKIGDTIADIAFAEVYQSTGSPLRLSNYNGKWIILDYWATWCGSCLKAIPKLNSLQRQYASNLQILMVSRKGTGDDAMKVTKALARLNFNTPCQFSIPILLNDTFALRHYELMVLPHYIWIDEHRIIRAITDADQVTQENIDAMLKGKPIVLKQKEDRLGH